MPGQHGKDTGIVLGSVDLTRWCNEVSGDSSVDVADASCFDEPQGSKVYVVGLNDSTFSFAGREQGSINSPTLRGTVEAAAATDLGAPLTVGIERGFHIGRQAIMGKVLSTSINLAAPVTDVVSVSGDMQSDGPTELGRVLTQKAAHAASVPIPVFVDLLSPSAGATINFHLVENTRNGGVTVTVQHSYNQSLWVDLAQYVSIAGEKRSMITKINTPVDRYVRAVVTLAGTTGTATIRVAIAVRK